MEGRFHDGRKAASHPARVELEGADVVVQAAGTRHVWPLCHLRVEDLGAEVRLARGPAEAARLTLAAADWRAAVRRSGLDFERRRRRRRLGGVLGLTAMAAGLAAVVFVGLPAASGPLARRTPPAFEARIGRNLEAQVSLAFPRCKDEAGQAALQGFGERLQSASGTPFHIRVRAVQAPIANAFALPGGAVMVTGKLIDLAQSPDELSAVIAHEAAHIERRHAMQSVWRSIGFGLVLETLVGGGTGAGQQAVLLAGSATNLGYTRRAEAEADARGQALLQADGLSSAGMAPFFDRLAAKGEGRDAAAVKELLSDHPDTHRRAVLSRARARPGASAFTPAEWAHIKAVCRGTPMPLQRLRRMF